VASPTTPTRTGISIAKAKQELEAAGRRWHRVSKHRGTYGECNERTCYHTNRLVAA